MFNREASLFRTDRWFLHKPCTHEGRQARRRQQYDTLPVQYSGNSEYSYGLDVSQNGDARQL